MPAQSEAQFSLVRHTEQTGLVFEIRILCKSPVDKLCLEFRKPIKKPATGWAIKKPGTTSVWRRLAQTGALGPRGLELRRLNARPSQKLVWFGTQRSATQRRGAQAWYLRSVLFAKAL
jgi:hypothetical protein